MFEQESGQELQVLEKLWILQKTLCQLDECELQENMRKMLMVS